MSSPSSRTLKVLYSAFYWDSVRYFHYLEKCLVSAFGGRIEFTRLCFYPSAMRYCREHGLAALYVPLASAGPSRGIPVRATTDVPTSLEDDACRYHARLLHANGELGRKLRQEADGIAAFYRQMFTETTFDLVLSSGDTRMQAELLVGIAREFGLVTRYFEQGPFGTTLFDVDGVNAQATLVQCRPAPIDPVAALREHMEDYYGRRREKFSGALSSLDKAWVYVDLLMQTGAVPRCAVAPLYLRSGQSLWSFIRGRLSTRVRSQKATRNPVKPYVALMLQMPQDANFVYFSPHYDSFEDIVEDVQAAVPKTHEIVVREHPLMRGQYSRRLYKLVRSSTRTILDNATPLPNQIDGADLVIVNNSTAGLDALARYRRVLTLGDSYYNTRTPVFNLTSRADLKRLVAEALNATVDRAAIDTALADLVLTRFFPGHFQDRIHTGGEEIARYLLKAIGGLLFTPDVDRPVKA